MKVFLKKYKDNFSNKSFLFSFLISAILLTASLVVNFFASQYATISASGPVTDIILSNTRVYDVDSIFVFGGIALAIFIIIVCLAYPKKIPFALKSIALFVLVRSVFISLTHIGPFPTEANINGLTLYYAQKIIGTGMLKAFFSGNDLFFSGHTGLPFLMSFIFWDEKWLRYIFIAISIILGITVLLGHLHYSIDVLAAYFITATIFTTAKIIFKKDYERSINKI